MNYSLDQNVKIYVSQKSDGSMNLSKMDNIYKFCQSNDIPIPALAEQVHGNKIVMANPEKIAKGADGLYSQKSIALGIRSADCIPMMLYNKSKDMLYALHCGRKGIIAGIIQNIKEIESDIEEAKVFLGPHIRVENYPLRKNDAELIKNSDYGSFLKKIGGQDHFNLTSACQEELTRIGVKRENISDCGIDTYADNRFYSYRKQGDNKNIQVFITIAKKI